ncbi:titin [Caerostris extrusa]|uniref:Titin n=1 Tax=Caerostris extrusa TaxID=172846 RepID=A0AAV4NRH7_CAEEX|nr:titin [Caerostris extrusa]
MNALIFDHNSMIGEIDETVYSSRLPALLAWGMAAYSSSPEIVCRDGPDDFVSGTPATTTISTIAVQSGNTRIVIALLQKATLSAFQTAKNSIISRCFREKRVTYLLLNLPFKLASSSFESYISSCPCRFWVWKFFSLEVDMAYYRPSRHSMIYVRFLLNEEIISVDRC